MILWTTSLALATVSPGALLQAEIDGLTVELPALETDLRAHIDGDIATVRLIQTFTNPDDEPISPRYVFPLPEDAAVYAMTLRTSTTVVTAEIARREEAEARFQQAARAGKQAAVLHQHRPNVFEQKVANLGPGETLSVELSYAQQIPREDGRYAFVAPLVVGPRFQPADADPTAPKLGQWAVGATAAAAPEKIDSERVKIEIVLDGGLPIQELSSPSHQVILGGEGAQRTVSLAKGRTIDNRDFVLNYTLTPEQLAVGSYAWAEEGRGVVALRIEPPTLVKPGSLTPREVVFVLDTSGSMRGFPMDASKRFMRRALQNLRPGDHFRIVRFSDSASTFAEGPVPANDETMQRALAYIDGLSGGGGTRMTAGIEAALSPPIPDGAVRIVVFLTDGYIGNELEVASLVSKKLGAGRLFAMGIGSSVNRWLIEELSHAGRGVGRIVLDGGAAAEAADRLAERLEAPLLTDVSIDWGGAPVRGVTPSPLPDVFVGEPLRVLARFDAPGTYPITVRGMIAGKPATLPVQLTLPESAPGSRALAQVWARSQIEDRMHRYVTPQHRGQVSGVDREALRQQITTLGLEYGLVTQWTSFVAVAPGEPTSKPASREVAVGIPTPAGVSPGPTSSGPSFGGSAAPEPAAWLAISLMLAAGGLGSWRRSRER